MLSEELVKHSVFIGGFGIMLAYRQDRREILLSSGRFSLLGRSVSSYRTSRIPPACSKTQQGMHDSYKIRSSLYQNQGMPSRIPP